VKLRTLGLFGGVLRPLLRLERLHRGDGRLAVDREQPVGRKRGQLLKQRVI
jgi:hypothetical protein